MAMATTVTGSALTPQRNNFFGGATGLRHHVKASAHANLLRTISAKLDSLNSLNSTQKAQDGSSTMVPPTLLAGAFFAALATSETASAAQQVMELAADNDSRGLALLVPLVPAIGWVLFNILQPGLNQLNRMRNAKGLAIGLGAGALAGLALSPRASAGIVAPQEIIGNIAAADTDSRGLILLGVLVPAIAWVLFNILQPGLNQLNRMRSSKAVVGGLGLGAALYYSPHADATTQEIATIAEGDNRGLLLLLVIAPAIGWVLFNILQPALNQLNRMRSGK